MSSTKPLELQGKRFGRLTVIKQTDNHHKGRHWLCRCDCGNMVEVSSYSLNKGITRSCGCLIKDILAERNKANQKHGMSRDRLYGIYYSMIHRCYYPQTNRYNRYGGRGIKVCDEWLKGFEYFKDWALQNGYQPNLSLDRIDSDDDYKPSNCRWVTFKEQVLNRNCMNFYTYKGKTLCVKDWARETGISYSALYQRLKRGMPFEEAINKPYTKRRSGKTNENEKEIK